MPSATPRRTRPLRRIDRFGLAEMWVWQGIVELAESRAKDPETQQFYREWRYDLTNHIGKEMIKKGW